MKKILFLLAMLPMFVFTACSDDDETLNQYESLLVGHWVEDTSIQYEVFNIEIKADKTGYQYVTNYGVVDDGKEAFTWSADESTITITIKGVGTSRVKYALTDDILIVYDDSDFIRYKRK